MVTTPALEIPGYLARLYPFRPRDFVTASGARMSYLDEGPRTHRAVLMLHGNPTWSFYYRNLVSRLSPSVRCIVPDHVGMGLSSRPEDHDYTLAGRIADVRALIDSLGIEKVDLVMHDWGGAIAMGLATADPARIGSLVITNTAAFPSARIPKRIALCRLPYLGALLVRGMNGFAEPATFMAMASRRLTWDERRSYLFPYSTWRNRVGVHRFVRDIPMEKDHPSRATLEGIAGRLSLLAGHPKAIFWGKHDFCFDLSFLSRWRELYPEAPVELVETAGHYLLEDCPAQTLEAIASFILSQKP